MSVASGSQVRMGFVSPRLAGKPPEAAGLSGRGAYSDFVYNGGPVINTPQVHILFVGDGWTSRAGQTRMTRLTQFVNDLLNSRYMNILSQNGCGTSGTVASTTVAGSDPRNDMKLGMTQGTSPSICALPHGGWQVAFQASTGDLWVVGSDPRNDTQLGMMQGTSPSICRG